ncbi:MAG: L-fuculokinase [Phycisphaerae bacterium]|nr:L-fuculokinase [Phycisphaerae bacterium]
MNNPIVIVWDCGATNFRAVAIDSNGRILAQAKAPNQTVPQPGGPPEWRIWDIEKIFSDLCRLTTQVVSQIDKTRIKALTITTWGADAAPVDREGNLVYPLISWQCPRTVPIMERVKTQLDANDVFRRTGYQFMSFNTLFKLMWIHENAPDAWEKTYKFMNHTGILNHRLTGRFSIDPTMAGTSMAFSVAERKWDNDLLALAGADDSIWPDLVEPGQVIGTIQPQAAEKTSLPVGLPVLAAGHDTQFALYGSGAALDEAILSSGTWEILLIRTHPFTPDQKTAESGILIEQDAAPGLIDPQFLMMASGTLEWVRKQFWYSDTDEGIYDKMTAEAQNVAPGAGGTTFLANFMPQAGPGGVYNTPGSIIGLHVNSSRGEIYRAALEGLSMQLRHALEVFGKTIKFNARAIRVVGGGSKNALWNQIRADVTGLPVITTQHTEATVLGAAMFALVGVGEFASIEQARTAIDVGQKIIEPSGAKADYQNIYDRYQRLLKTVGPNYAGKTT